MRKFIFLMAMLFTVSISTFAQVEPNKFTDNWSVGAEAGAFTPMDFNSVFPLNYAGAITLEKAVTPVLSFRGHGTALFGPFNAGTFSNYFPYNGSTFVKATNVGLDGVINWTNVFKGYVGEPRVFEVSTVTGLGWLHFYNDDVNQDSQNFMSAKTGVDFAYNFGADKQFKLYAEPVVLWNLSHTRLPKFNSQFAQVGVNVGFVYRLKNSVGTHNFVKVRKYDQSEIDRLNTRINELETQNARRPRVAPVPPRAHEKVVYKDNVQVANVWFAFDSDELTSDAKVALDKVSTENEVVVTGYASSEGNASYNQKLSERRAQAVAEYLKSRGVKVKEVVGKGVAERELNRVVFVK